MAAYTDEQTTESFRLLLEDLAEETGREDLEVEDASGSFMVPAGESLTVTDPSTGVTYLLTVRRVDS